jgi:hypothetical protein
MGKVVEGQCGEQRDGEWLGQLVLEMVVREDCCFVGREVSNEGGCCGV